MPKRVRSEHQLCQPSLDPVDDSQLSGRILVAGSNDMGQLGIVGFGKRAKPSAPVIQLSDEHDDLSPATCTILRHQPLLSQSWWETRDVRQVAAGAIHSAVLLRGSLGGASSSSNCVVAFGAAEDFQRGVIDPLIARNSHDDATGNSASEVVEKLDPTDIPEFFPVVMNSLPAGIVQIAAGDGFTAALSGTDGHVYVTGTLRSPSGNLACLKGMTRITGRRNLRRPLANGVNNAVDSATVPHVKVSKLVAGFNHLAVLDENGQVYTMGRFHEGQLGRIETTDIIYAARDPDVVGVRVEHRALQLEQVTATRSAAQLRRMREQRNGGGSNKRMRGEAAKSVSTFGDVWATPLGLFLRDAVSDAIYACGSNSVGQLGLPLKWSVKYEADAVVDPDSGISTASKPKITELVGYFQGRKVVKFELQHEMGLPPTPPSLPASTQQQRATSLEVDDNLLALNVIVDLPEHVPAFDGLDVIKIVGSEVHTLALTRSGDVYVFGCNKFYALGLNKTQLCRAFAQDINENRKSSTSSPADSVTPAVVSENDEILQERLRDTIFVPITRLLSPSSTTTADAVQMNSAGALRDEPIESIAAGSRNSYFITQRNGRLYRCGDNNSKLAFIRVMDELDGPNSKYVKNMDFIKRRNDVLDIALIRPLLYESDLLNDSNRVLSLSIGGQHALLIAQHNEVQD